MARPPPPTEAILLVGDSILDNHHWFSPPVGHDCTGDTLQALLPKCTVLNHSVEETMASEWYDERDSSSVNPHAAKTPRGIYQRSAKRDGVQTSYPMNVDREVEFFPAVAEFDHPKLSVVVSAIGNDLFLAGEWGTLIFKPRVLRDRLRGIFKQYRLTYPWCKLVYVFPYLPTHLFGIDVTWGLSARILRWYVKWFKNQLSEDVDMMIDLSTEFKPVVHYDDPGTGIPEPTKEGARHLARLIRGAHEMD